MRYARVTDAGAGSGWRTKWVLRLSATDKGGAGVALRQISIDKRQHWQGAGTTLVLKDGGSHAFDGVHKVYYRSADAASNVERTRSVTVRIDSKPPQITCPKKGLSAATGQVVRLRYRAIDRKPCAGWVRLKADFFTSDA